MPDPTLDPVEVAKFDALASEWWNPKGPFGALHRLNPVRLRFVRDVAARHFAGPNKLRLGRHPLSGLDVLDLGCGGGLVSAPMTRMGARVTGLDASSEAIGAARAYAAQAGLDIDYCSAGVESLVARGAAFDLVTALEIVEHVADVNAFLAAAAALVKPGGLLIVSTINRTPKAHALAIVGAEQVLGWAPKGAHQYEKLVTPAEIRSGAPVLEWEAPMGLSYNPFGSGWELSGDVDVNYLMAGRRPTAPRSQV